MFTKKFRDVRDAHLLAPKYMMHPIYMNPNRK